MQIYVAKSGQQTGPFSEEQIHSMLKSGMVGLADSAWHEGLTSWLPLNQLLDVCPPIPQPTQAPLLSSQRSTNAQHSGEHASFGIRFGAHIIDAIIFYVAAFICGAPICLSLLFISAGRTSEGDLQGIAALVSIVTSWLYYALMESSSKQATVGKLACGLFVTDMHGQRIGFGRASGRYFGMFVSAIILCIGFLMCAWTKKKQCLHDMMANCLVLRK